MWGLCRRPQPGHDGVASTTSQVHWLASDRGGRCPAGWEARGEEPWAALVSGASQRGRQPNWDRLSWGELSGKNQPELPKRHTDFNRSGQAAQGWSRAGGGGIAPGQVLLPAPSHVAVDPLATSEHQRSLPGPPLPRGLRQHQWAEAVSPWREVRAAWGGGRERKAGHGPTLGEGEVTEALMSLTDLGLSCFSSLDLLRGPKPGPLPSGIRKGSTGSEEALLARRCPPGPRHLNQAWKARDTDWAGETGQGGSWAPGRQAPLGGRADRAEGDAEAGRSPRRWPHSCVGAVALGSLPPGSPLPQNAPSPGHPWSGQSPSGVSFNEGHWAGREGGPRKGIDTVAPALGSCG